MNHSIIRTIQSLAFSAAALMPVAAVSQTRHNDPEDWANSSINDALHARNPETRQQAVESMSLLAEQKRFQSRLESMLQDKDVKVRISAIASMMSAPNERTVAVLKSALSDPAPEVSFAAARALFTLDDPAGKQALISVLQGASKSSAKLLTERKREAARMLHEPQKLTVFVATKSVWLVPVPGVGFAASSAEHALTDPRVPGRATTAMLLATDDDPAIPSLLATALRDKDAAVRIAAIQAVALRSDTGMQKEIRPLLEDKRQSVRVWAAACYLHLEQLKAPQTAAIAASAPSED